MFALLTVLAVSAQAAHAACLWDAKDQKLYCSWGDEVRPVWAEVCKPPTPEPMRSGGNMVYCGSAGGSGVVSDAQLAKSPPTEMNLDCEVIKAPPKCRQVKAYSECKTPGMVRSSATSDGLLCCDPSVNEIRMQLKCKVSPQK
jgi:hypothetical protein